MKAPKQCIGENLDAEGCRAVLKRHFSELEVAAVEVLNGGWDSRVFIVDGGYIFRFPRREYALKQLRMEVGMLPELAPLLNLAIPRFEFISPALAEHDADAPAFVGYPLIAGEFLTPGVFRECVAGRPAEKHIAPQFGKFLTKLHAFPQARAVELGVELAGRDSFPKYVEKLRKMVMPLLSPKAASRVERFGEESLKLWKESSFEPVLAHNDLSAEHILFDRERGCISGVIDFGDMMIDDPAGDFVGFRYEYGEEFARRVLAHYERGLDELAFSRMAMYRKLSPFHWVTYGLETGQPEFTQRGVQMLEQEW